MFSRMMEERLRQTIHWEMLRRKGLNWPPYRLKWWSDDAQKSNDALWHVLLLFSQLQQEIAARVGLSRPQATNTIRGRFGVSRSIVRRVLELAKVA